MPVTTLRRYRTSGDRFLPALRDNLELEDKIPLGFEITDPEFSAFASDRDDGIAPQISYAQSTAFTGLTLLGPMLPQLIAHHA